MSDEPSAHNSDCESNPNRESAKESSNKTKEQGSGSSRNPFFKPSGVAATIGFGLLGFAFMFCWWFQDLLENFFHASPFAVCCIIIILFIFGTIGVAWLCIELWKKPKPIIGAAVVVVLLFIFVVFETERKPDFFAKMEKPDTNAKQSNEYQLLAPITASNIVQMLKDPSGHVHPAAILICLSNPDDSAVAFSEQLKKLFWDGGYLLVNGAPPSDIPEKPRISCFVYGNAMSNIGIWRALDAILDATKSNSRPEAMGAYPNTFRILWPPLSSLPPSASPAELKSAADEEMVTIAMTSAEFSVIATSRPPPVADSIEVMRRVGEDGSSWTNSIVLIMIRSK